MNNNHNQLQRCQLSLTYGKRMALLACLFCLCFLIGGVLGYLVLRVGHNGRAALRISTVVQDIVVFIVPAVALAVMITRRPDRFLLIDRSPVTLQGLVAVVTLLAAIPLMNSVVAWNEGLHLPDSMASVEQWIMASEERARELISTLMGGGSVMDLVMGLLIVGVLAGVSEELFFRGALQRLMMTRPMNPHAAIWITAVIFSVFHFQFYGFVPRMLLGAFLGYAAWWSGSLWVPVVVHALNNMLVVLASWLKETGCSTIDFNKIGVGGSVTDIVLVAASAALTVAGIMTLRRISRRNRDVSQTSCGGI